MKTQSGTLVDGLRRWRQRNALRSKVLMACEGLRALQCSTSEGHRQLLKLHDEATELARLDRNYSLVRRLRRLIEQSARRHDREFGPHVGGQLALRYLAWKHAGAPEGIGTTALPAYERALGHWTDLTSWHREQLYQRIVTLIGLVE